MLLVLLDHDKRKMFHILYFANMKMVNRSQFYKTDLVIQLVLKHPVC